MKEIDSGRANALWLFIINNVEDPMGVLMDGNLRPLQEQLMCIRRKAYGPKAKK